MKLANVIDLCLFLFQATCGTIGLVVETMPTWTAACFLCAGFHIGMLTERSLFRK